MYKVINTMYVWRHRRLRSPRYSSGRRRLQAFQSMSLSATFVYSRTFLLFAAPRCCSASCIVSMLIIRLPEAMPGCTLRSVKGEIKRRRSCAHHSRESGLRPKRNVVCHPLSFFSLDLSAVIWLEATLYTCKIIFVWTKNCIFTQRIL